jgi:DNA invertase Pin-like site-specific DNA recombinase
MSDFAAIEEKLLAAMLECGASPSLAKIHAADFAAIINPKIIREKREQEIADLFPMLGVNKVVERFSVARTTAYRILRKCQKRREIGTSPNYLRSCEGET